MVPPRTGEFGRSAPDTASLGGVERQAVGVLAGGGAVGCLAKLEAAGLVGALPPEARRHPYRITTRGVEVLERELSDFAHIAKVGLGRIAATMA